MFMMVIMMMGGDDGGFQDGRDDDESVDKFCFCFESCLFFQFKIKWKCV